MNAWMLLGQPMGQGWYQLAELGLAFVLSASIGLEREVRQKSAGLRTYDPWRDLSGAFAAGRI